MYRSDRYVCQYSLRVERTCRMHFVDCLTLDAAAAVLRLLPCFLLGHTRAVYGSSDLRINTLRSRYTGFTPKIHSSAVCCVRQTIEPCTCWGGVEISSILSRPESGGRGSYGRVYRHFGEFLGGNSCKSHAKTLSCFRRKADAPVV